MTVSKPETVEVAQSERDLLEQLSWLTYIFDETGPNPLAVTLLKRHRLNATPSRQDGLREALEEISDPIGTMRRNAEALGRRLEGGVAYSLSNDPNYLKEIARKALAERPRIGHASGCVKINCAGCGTDFYSTDYSLAAPAANRLAMPMRQLIDACMLAGYSVGDETHRKALSDAVIDASAALSDTPPPDQP